MGKVHPQNGVPNETSTTNSNIREPLQPASTVKKELRKTTTPRSAQKHTVRPGDSAESPHIIDWLLSSSSHLLPISWHALFLSFLCVVCLQDTPLLYLIPYSRRSGSYQFKVLTWGWSKMHILLDSGPKRIDQEVWLELRCSMGVTLAHVLRTGLEGCTV